MPKLPKDCSARRIGSEARKLVHYKFSSERWEFHELTGKDNGLDCTLELVENEQFTNKKIEGQIKGTQNPHKLKNENAFSFPIDVKTVNYGLESSNAYVLFYVSVEDEIVYYLPIQDYFMQILVCMIDGRKIKKKLIYIFLVIILFQIMILIYSKLQKVYM